MRLKKIKGNICWEKAPEADEIFVAEILTISKNEAVFASDSRKKTVFVRKMSIVVLLK